MAKRFCVCPSCKRAVAWRPCKGGAGDTGRPVFHVDAVVMGKRCAGRYELIDLSDTRGTKAELSSP